MNTSVVPSNVYYLPVRTETTEDVAGHRSTTLGARLRRAWWRLRFSGAEIWLIVRRTARQLRSDGEPRLPRPDRIEPTRSVGPARIIDFSSARRRLRPASA